MCIFLSLLLGKNFIDNGNRLGAGRSMAAHQQSVTFHRRLYCKATIVGWDGLEPSCAQNRNRLNFGVFVAG